MSKASFPRPTGVTTSRTAADRTPEMNAPASERARLALTRPDLFREQAYVDGQWIGADETLSVANPATGRAPSRCACRMARRMMRRRT